MCSHSKRESMKKVIVCVNARANPDQPSCAARGGLEIADALERALLEGGLPLVLERFACLGRCNMGPNIKFSPGGQCLHHVRPNHLAPVLRAAEAFVRTEKS